MNETATVESRAEEVVFFEDRARVLRRAKASLQPGINRLRVTGISLLVDDSSLTVLADSNARILTSKIVRDVHETSRATQSEIKELEARVRRANDDRNRLQARLERLWHHQRRLHTVEDTYLHDVKNLKCDADLKKALAAYDQPLRELVDEIHALEPELQDAKRELSRASELLQSARATHPEFSAWVDVQFETDEAAELEFEIGYQVACALWRPSHQARLDRKRSQVHVRNSATVWQLTGEVWEDVICRFSTARPSRAASPPLLSDDVLSARAKSSDERKVVHVEAREVDIQDTGADGARAVEEMPGVDDGGDPLCLEAIQRVSIPSNGEPFRIDVGDHTVDVKVDRVVFPQYGATAHIRAKGTWSGSYPLLAGPVHLMRDTVFSGRALINFVAPGDAVELGFGVDSTVTVKRKEDTHPSTTRITGRTNLKRKVDLFLSNLSSDPVRVKVIERTPVSEIEDVEIKDFEGAMPDQDGFCEFELELEPRQTRCTRYSYLISHASNVNLRI